MRPAHDRLDRAGSRDHLVGDRAIFRTTKEALDRARALLAEERGAAIPPATPGPVTPQH